MYDRIKKKESIYESLLTLDLVKAMSSEEIIDKKV